MSVGPLHPVGGELTVEEKARLAGLVAAVLGDRQPRVRLGRTLDALKEENRPALAAALFEGVVYRIDTRDFWIYFRMMKVYAQLGPERQDAAFLTAALAAQLAPEKPAAGHAFKAMFGILHGRGRPADAVDLFRHQLRHVPEAPALDPWEVIPALAELGEKLPPARRPSCAEADRRDHSLFPAELREPWFCKAADGLVPLGLRSLATGTWRRPAVAVAELPDAEVLVLRDTVLVLDRSGTLHPDLSVAFYPGEVRAKFARLEAEGTVVPLHEAEEAVVISDYCPPPNLCHFLLDQFSRLALYERAGADIGRALVIGPQPAGTFREAVLRRAGIASVLGTDGVARLRVRRLRVASNCREVRHFAHWGAAWAIEFVRRALGGRGTRGTRRLYVSRSDAARRHVANEAEVAALLAPHGFEVIVPGRMPHEEQVAAFREASHVIAPHGAALAHMVLCPPEARVLEIFHPLFTQNAFAMQAQAAGTQYVAMLAGDAASDAPAWNEPADTRGMERHAARDMRVDLDRLSRYLATVM